MLEFNPDKRYSVDVLLAHKFFKDVRNRKKEKEAPQPIKLDIDEFEEFDEEMLREGFINEASLLKALK